MIFITSNICNIFIMNPEIVKKKNCTLESHLIGCRVKIAKFNFSKVENYFCKFEQFALNTIYQRLRDKLRAVIYTTENTLAATGLIKTAPELKTHSLNTCDRAGLSSAETGRWRDSTSGNREDFNDGSFRKNIRGRLP